MVRNTYARFGQQDLLMLAYLAVFIALVVGLSSELQNDTTPYDECMAKHGGFIHCSR